MMDAVQCRPNHRHDHTKELDVLKTVVNDQLIRKGKNKSFLKKEETRKNSSEQMNFRKGETPYVLK